MKYSAKIITTSVAICFVLALMVVGIWSATIQVSNVSATLSFIAEVVDVQLLGRVTGAKETNIYWSKNIESNKKNSQSTTWDIGSLTFNDTTKTPIKIGVAIRNNGTDTNPYCKPSINISIPSCVTLTYKQIGGTTAKPYTTKYTSTGFTSTALSTLSYASAYTASSGTTIPAYNPTTSELTTNKVYYFEIIFTLVDWNVDVDTFSLSFGMEISSSQIA